LQSNLSFTKVKFGVVKHSIVLFRPPGRVTFLCLAERKVTKRKAIPKRLADAARHTRVFVRSARCDILPQRASIGRPGRFTAVIPHCGGKR